MSIYKYWWRPCIELCIRHYMELKARDDLSLRERFIAESVKCAIQDADEEEIAIIKMVDFERSHSLKAAAAALGMDPREATQRRSNFINAVAAYMGYLTFSVT